MTRASRDPAANMAAPTRLCCCLFPLLLGTGIVAAAGTSGTPGTGDCGCSASRAAGDAREVAARRYSAAAAGSGRSAGRGPVSGGAGPGGGSATEGPDRAVGRPRRSTGSSGITSSREIAVETLQLNYRRVGRTPGKLGLGAGTASGPVSLLPRGENRKTREAASAAVSAAGPGGCSSWDRPVSNRRCGNWLRERGTAARVAPVLQAALQPLENV